jgi:hypothetical protein
MPLSTLLLLCSNFDCVAQCLAVLERTMNLKASSFQCAQYIISAKECSMADDDGMRNDGNNDVLERGSEYVQGILYCFDT